MHILFVTADCHSDLSAEQRQRVASAVTELESVREAIAYCRHSSLLIFNTYHSTYPEDVVAEMQTVLTEQFGIDPDTVQWESSVDAASNVFELAQKLNPAQLQEVRETFELGLASGTVGHKLRRALTIALAIAEGRSKRSVAAETRRLMSWLRALAVQGTIDRLHLLYEDCRRSEVERICRAMPDATKAEIEELSHRLIDQLLKRPVAHLRSSDVHHPDRYEYWVRIVEELFDLPS